MLLFVGNISAYDTGYARYEILLTLEVENSNS
jgi:hypothetical protein